ncbi:DsbA family oxidoreductase [Mangrovitalea sediminis]|uniref:DsbA family oxidoreductase n=1 Tax=Mangrovitalea sediminis TaxID=1982043 RepID=UPI000BE50B63|nr:DsbA family oxidoreductase [Mangrovitalea sediminis]
MKTLRIDIVSDVVCPWCIIGFKRLSQAMESVADECRFEIAWHPFELNPQLGPEGENADEHLARKYGIGPEEVARNRQHITDMGRRLGFRFHYDADRKVYNTFDAHRILYWAQEQGNQTDISLALFEAYFSDGLNPSAPEVLTSIAERLGLNAQRVSAILESDDYADAVRDAEDHYRRMGIQAVPAYIINERYLISGGQEPDVFIQAFRQIASEAA